MKKMVCGVGLAVLSLGLTVGDATAQQAATGVSSDTEWNIYGSVRPRYESRFNHHFDVDDELLNYRRTPDSTDTFTQQSRLGLKAKRGLLSGEWLLQHTATLGAISGTLAAAPALSIQRAWLSYQLADNAYLQAGRFELFYGTGLVLGNNPWNQVGRAWDAVRVGIAEKDNYFVDAFVGKYQEGMADGTGFLEGDSFLSGIYASRSALEAPFIETVDLYGLYDVQLGDWSNDSVHRRHLGMVGTRLAGKSGWFGANAEGGYQFGYRCLVDDNGCTNETQAIGAWYVESSLSATWFINAITLQYIVGYSRASGDDPDTDRMEQYDSLYGNAHGWLGLTDIVGARTNIQEIRTGFTAAYKNSHLSLMAHDFRRLEPEMQRVGTEVDLVFTQKFQDNLSLNFGHGIFLAGDGMTVDESTPQGIAQWSFLQLVAGF